MVLSGCLLQRPLLLLLRTCLVCLVCKTTRAVDSVTSCLSSDAKQCHGRLQRLRLEDFSNSTSCPSVRLTCDFGASYKLDVADLDGNGDLDVIVSGAECAFKTFTKSNGCLVELFGDQNPLQAIKPVTPPCFRAVDWDNDGDVDLILGVSSGADNGNATIEYYEQLPSGKFAGRHGASNPFGDVRVELGRDIPLCVDVVDWDGDGDRDLIVGADEAILYYEQVAAGQLVQRLKRNNPFYGISVGDRADVRVVDWDGDDDLDVVVGAGDGTVRYLERLGDGSLFEHTGVSSPFNGIQTTSLVASPRVFDWDGDGDLDLLVDGGDAVYPTPPIGLELMYYARTAMAKPVERATGGFENVNPNVGRSARPSVVDMDGDGDLDLIVVSHMYPVKVNYFERLPDRSFVERPGVAASLQPLLQQYDSYEFSDWDKDGSVEVIVAKFPSDTIKYYKRVANGNFREQLASANPFRSLKLCAPLVDIKVLDATKDGHLDIFAGCYDGSIKFFENDGKGTLVDRGVMVSNSSFYRFDAADWDGDGDLDLILGDRFGHLRYFERTGSCIDCFVERTHTDSTAWDPLLKVGGSPDPVVADWNGDGLLDLLCGAEDGTVKYYQGGFCGLANPCSGKGLCDAFRNSCTCVEGYTGDDCSGCGQGFHTSGHVNGNVRTCAACPRIDDGEACSGRGVCSDDQRARQAASRRNLSNTSVLLAHGDGECKCSETQFTGKACESGVCSAGTEEREPFGGGPNQCRPCAQGTFAAAGDECSECQVGKFSSRRQGTCTDCSAGRYNSETGSAGCRIDPWYYIAAVCAFVLFAVSIFLLVASLFYRVSVSDVCLEEEAGMQPQLIVTTSGAHCIHRRRKPIPVQFKETAHPGLDKPETQFHVRALSGDKLCLLTASGSPIKDSLDTSKGIMRVHFRHALLAVGPAWFVPVGLLVPAILAVTIVIVVLAELHPVVIAVEAIVSILLAVATYAYILRAKTHTPLRQRLTEYHAKISKVNPDPRPCPRGPHRALALGQVKTFFDFFQAHIRSRNMYYLAGNVLLPLTATKRLSFAELIGPKVVKWFVSHFWGTPFQHFCDTLINHAQTVSSNAEDINYWICSMSVNQYKVAEEVGSNSENSSFFLAVRSETCIGTAMVLDDHVLPLRRSWCLFEVLQTLMLGNMNDRWQGLWLCTSTGVLHEGRGGVDVAMRIADELAKLRLQDASASVQADKDMIEGEIQKMPGGFDAMNSYVRKSICDALYKMKTSFDYDFADLVARLHTDNEVKSPDVSDGGTSIVPVELSTEPLTLPGMTA
eukprot:TRINITY_DN28466_c0_g2_i1.p1 TRINITY_DN28466_c0_g2~~TRINITY_DN28466_c0_g2_i1.p1  ORF type:complete len:1290 (+),score=143.94 TRINITY_DN28466_c0_g2_i1:48-3917(+)